VVVSILFAVTSVVVVVVVVVLVVVVVVVVVVTHCTRWMSAELSCTCHMSTELHYQICLSSMQDK
jgi:hypothetical protein